MRNIKSKGFGLIGLIIVIAVIALLVFGYQNLKGESQKNQIEQGQDAIKQAQDAANKESQSTIDIQNQLNGSADVNYHGIQNQLQNINP